MTVRSHLFEFYDEEEDNEFAIFAHSELKARAMYEAVRPRDVVMPPGWLGGEVTGWHTWGKPEHLTRVCEGGWEGIGLHLPDHGTWVVLPMPKEVW